MMNVAAIVCGVLCLPAVLGALQRWDGREWGVTKGIDPAEIKRHVYVVSEWCPKEPRAIDFGDEIIVESQRPWIQGYVTGLLCKMKMQTSSPEVGLIVSILSEDTATCEDFLRIVVLETGDTSLYCGPHTNVTGTSNAYINQTIQLEWTTMSGRQGFQEGRGFMALFTAYQNTCNKGQVCFPCTNGLIIDQVHMCNGLNNCGDFSDELGCPPHYAPPPPEPAMAASVIFLICAFVLSILAIIGLSMYTFKLYQRTRLHRDYQPGERRSLYDGNQPEEQADA